MLADAAPADHALVSGLGANFVVARGPQFADEVRRRVAQGVDAVFDTAALTRTVLPAIRDGGSIAVVRGWDNHGDPERGIVVHLVSVGVAFHRTDWLQLLATQAANGNLPLPGTDSYPAEDAIKAYSSIETDGLRRRPVITFTSV